MVLTQKPQIAKYKIIYMIKEQVIVTFGEMRVKRAQV